MIKAENVKKVFGPVTVLEDVNLTVNPGEVVSILGSSGSGKSTLIRCINGLERLDGGKITVDDFDVSKPRELAEARKRSGTVFQLFNLYPHMTAVENVTLAPIEVLKRPKAEAEKEARALLASVGLSERADAYPAQLSGGQRQRVGICRALAMKPRYLLLDEVTSALDPEMTAEVLNILAKLAEEGTTMVFVTHEIEFARQISDRVVFLEKGRLVVDLPTEQFFAEDGGMANPRVAQFLSKMRKD
ncbi:arginine ABC transporter ATP-binding protein [Youhaiella tibetensis]|uniref:Amino acid ABC transporter ATP-binding protein n=1 Tax=Paradevosia tibetensis TaxID=1447062 RepID=A0A5B9DJ52_9HYPH|nr:amino acid ABC transporter ATP-binding protein [Youhaiella tibetensis]AKR57899.1 ABC transporter [Devosia sp. H5989]QEE18778.1 amino acid ABC transporter ATP-binding protein [Youhaiella tibetensis]GGF39278.1 arginine ABC transporter ATP-binding protein [Youhaiella tibetensis]